jgi:hypothetical protein
MKLEELYQLPLGEFTKARNAFAKDLSGDARRAAASLVKPTLPCWAINQLYWKDRSTYKALVDASEKLRVAHRAALGGKNVDLRKPNEVHRAAVLRATAKTVQLLEQADGRVTEPVRETIGRLLAALPTDEQAGRLTREPEPAGFALLAGVKLRPVKALPPQPKPERTTVETKRDEAAERREQQHTEKARQVAERQREKLLTAARRELQRAQQAAERATFNARKAESELKEAERRLADLQRH